MTETLLVVLPDEAMVEAAGCGELASAAGRSFEEIVSGWDDGGYFPEQIVGYVDDGSGPPEGIDPTTEAVDLPPLPLRHYSMLSITVGYFVTVEGLIRSRGWTCEPDEIADGFVGALSEEFTVRRWPQLQATRGAWDLEEIRQKFVEYFELVGDAGTAGS